MANFGRFVCVLLPFALTLGSLIAMLVAGLAGVADKSLYMFQINVTDLSISPTDLADIVTKRSPVDTSVFHNSDLLPATENKQTDNTLTTNITAGDLGLGNLYDVSLWGYCEIASNGSRSCTKAEFDWASKQLNTSENSLNNLATSAGVKITLPKTITDALKVFGTLTKWTEVVFIIAWAALAVELFFGIFASCSRAFSCITFIVAGVATVAVVAAAAMATATAVVVVGTVEGTAKWYGVKADFSTGYLAAVWIGAAFAIAAGFFWLFTICCCAPDHSSRRGHGGRRTRHLDEDGEKLMPVSGTGYRPLQEPDSGYYHQQGANQYGAPRYPTGAGRSDLAYEPYSHGRV